MASQTRSSAQVNHNAAMTKVAMGIPYDPRDAYIAVMGVAGSGKSTFISRLCGGGPNIGHGLESCTAEIEVFSFKCDGKSIHLIDTLGFNDTYRTDSDVLKDLVFWLNASYYQQIRLSGIVYLHPIHETRMTGASRKHMKIFRQLCGDSNLQSVVLATTMWKASTDDSTRREFEDRQEQLRLNPDFWGGMASRGSPVLRHNDNVDSALNIIRYILDQNKRITLQVQREMIEDGKRLDQTLAGKELSRELLEQQRLFEKRLQDAQVEMKEAVEEGSEPAVQEAAGQQENIQQQLEMAMKGSEQLKISMDKIVEQKELERQKVQEALEARQKLRTEQTPPPAYDSIANPPKFSFRQALEESVAVAKFSMVPVKGPRANFAGFAAMPCNVM